MPLPLSLELILAYVALAFGTAIAVFFAGRHSSATRLDEQDASIEEDVDLEHPSQAYHADIKPLQEESNGDLVEKLRKAARDLAARMPDGITSDDIHEMCDIPPNVDRRIMGAVFSKTDWVHVGWVASRRKINHGRPVRIWKRKTA